MYHTLGELRQSIDKLIKKQGENAACSAFIHTKEDVFTFNPETGEEIYYSTEFSEDVLYSVGDSSYIYEQIGELIDTEIIKRKKLNSIIPIIK